MLRTWYRTLIDVCFPPRCVFCDALRTSGTDAVCPDCTARSTWLRHPVLTDYFPQPAWGQIMALCRFSGPVTEAIHRLKYQERRDMAPELARLLAPLVRAASYDWIIPVPLADARLRERGYNQSQLLAATLARSLHIPFAIAGLARVRATASQVGLPARTRVKNLRGAFAVRGPAGVRFRQARILVIDDVLTTGATMHECARALRRAGAQRVDGLVIAVT